MGVLQNSGQNHMSQSWKMLSHEMAVMAGDWPGACVRLSGQLRSTTEVSGHGVTVPWKQLQEVKCASWMGLIYSALQSAMATYLWQYAASLLDLYRAKENRMNESCKHSGCMHG